MEHDLTFLGNPGSRLFVYSLDPASPRALALLVHGAGSHSGPYFPFAWELASRGIAVTALDLPGHGMSDGRPAHIGRYTHYLPALGEAWRWSRGGRRSGLPSFLVGESYGAILALHYALRYPEGVAGLILSAPAFRIAGVGGPARRAVKILGEALPWLRLPFASPPVSSHPYAGEVTRRHPFLRRRFTARYLSELLEAGEQAIGAAPRLTLPVLFLLSAADGVVDNRVSLRVFSLLASRDKSCRLHEGLAHALLVEAPSRLAQDAGEWIISRIGTEELSHPGG